MKNLKTIEPTYKINKSISCGDWGLGWGSGGKNKIGKLKCEGENIFVWRGHSQGRHGQRWNKGAWVRFSVTQGKITIIDSSGQCPPWFILMEGVNGLIIR